MTKHLSPLRFDSHGILAPPCRAQQKRALEQQRQDEQARWVSIWCNRFQCLVLGYRVVPGSFARLQQAGPPGSHNLHLALGVSLGLTA